MAITIVALHVIVVVFPVLGPGVVRRVDVDGVDLALVEVDEQLQRVEVLAVDNRMMGSIERSSSHRAD